MDSSTERRAQRLARWYPSTWRDRYGEEFVELLRSEIEERPHSAGRTLNVAMSGSFARLQVAGLAGDVLADEDQARASFSVLGVSLSVFLLFGIGIWAQLAIGWQWSAPDNQPTVWSMVAMSVSVAALACLGLLAAVPVIWSIARNALRRHSVLRAPALLFIASAAVLFIGGRHFGNGWPGTGGHPWAHQGLVPGGVAAFSWASTLSVTSYWAHPAALLHFPAAEVLWMAVSPLAVIGVTVASVKIIRRLDLSEKVIAYEAQIVRVACVAMLGLFAGGLGWLADGGPGPRNLFHAGAIDYVGLGAMATSLVIAIVAAERVRSRPRLAAHN